MKPKGTCYSDVVDFIIENVSINDDHVKIVHGRLTKPNGIIDHAWVKLSDSRVWEPQSRRYFEENSFDEFVAGVDAEYSPRQVLRLLGSTGNYGPWTKDEREFFLD